MAQANARRFTAWLQAETRPKVLIPTLTMGVMTGAVEVLYALSIASLIFSGELAPYLPYGIGISLVSSVVLLTGTAAISSVPGIFSSTQDSPAVMTGVMVASLAASLGAAGRGADIATILIAIAATTVLTGILFLVLGYFKLGRLIRFMPYPVMGGFLAGTGWLLMSAALGVMTDLPLTVANLSKIVVPAGLALWLPGVLLALALFFGIRRFQHFLTVPVLVLATVGLFYLVLLLTHTSVPDATARGLLLGRVAGNALWDPFTLGSQVFAVDWAAILAQSGNIGIVLVISVVGFLLNVSALELATRQDIRLDYELKVVGFANMLSGLLGGMVGYHMLGDTTLNQRVGARGQLVGIVTGLVCLVTFLAGSSLLAYLPRAIIGGLLFFLGLEFLVDWVIVGWKKLSRTDYGIVVLILLVIATTNFLLGVGVGTVAAVFLFVMQYGRTSVVHDSLTGAEMGSNVERSPHQRRALAARLGQQIRIFELQGFLFFGSANALLDRIEADIAGSGDACTRFLIFDFRRVTGLDSSAGLSLVKAKQRAEAQDICLVLTHASGEALRQFDRAGLFQDGKEVGLFPDLDHGLEWCENQLLGQPGLSHPTGFLERLQRQLRRALPGLKDAGRLTKYMERQDVPQGQYLVRRGDPPTEIYFVEAGVMDVQLERPGGETVRLRSFRGGATVGEIGLYLGIPRTASVVAAQPSVVYRLSAEALIRMRLEDPEVASLFHEWIARILAERLAANDRTIEALMK